MMIIDVVRSWHVYQQYFRKKKIPLNLNDILISFFIFLKRRNNNLNCRLNTFKKAYSSLSVTSETQLI